MEESNQDFKDFQDYQRWAAQNRAAAPAAGPAASSVLARTQLTAADVLAAARIHLRVLGPALVAIVIVVAVAAHFSLPSGHGGGLADWLRTGIDLVGLAAGGSILMALNADSGSTADHGTVVGRGLPLTLTLGMLLVAALLSRRSERAEPSASAGQLAARAGLFAVMGGALLAVLVATAHTSSAYGYPTADQASNESYQVAISSVSAGFGGLLLFGLAGFLGRRWAQRPEPALASQGKVAAFLSAERLTGLRPAVRLLRLAGSAYSVVALLAVIGLYLYAAIHGEGSASQLFASLLALLVVGPNLALVAAMAALGIPLTYSGYGTTDFSFMAPGRSGAAASVSIFDAHAYVWLLIAVPPVTILAVAVRRSLRELSFAESLRGPKVLQCAALVGSVATLAAALLLRVSGSANLSGEAGLGSAGGTSHVGPSLLWSPLLGAVWGAGAVVIARCAPTVALSLPWLSRRLAGRDIEDAWAQALRGTGPAPSGTARQSINRGAKLVLLAAAVAGIGLLAVESVNTFVRTPQSVAVKYLTAVAHNDLPAVAKQGAPAPDSSQLLLSAAVLRSSDFKGIADPRVLRMHAQGASSTADISYKLDDQRQTATLNLSRTSTFFGLLDVWQVQAALPTLRLSSAGSLGATIAGQELSSGDFTVMPGVYTVHASKDELLTAPDVSVTVALGGTGTAAFTPELREGVLDLAREAVTKALTACTKSTDRPLVNCPFTLPASSVDGPTIDAITITSLPTFNPYFDPSTSSIRIGGTESGSFTASGTHVFLDTGEVTPYSSEGTFSLEGSVAVSNGIAVVSFTPRIED